MAVYVAAAEFRPAETVLLITLGQKKKNEDLSCSLTASRRPWGGGKQQ